MMACFDQPLSFWSISCCRPQPNRMSLCKVTATPYTGEAVARGDNRCFFPSILHLQSSTQDNIRCLQEWWQPHQ